MMSIFSDRRRGQIVPRSANKFLLRVDLGTLIDPDTGKVKRLTQSKTFTGTRAEAEKAMTALVGKKDTFTLPRPSRASVGQASETWLSGRASISKRTAFNYRGRLDAYVLPTFGHRKIASVSREDVQAWIVSLAARYSPGTVRQAYLTLSQVFDVEVRDGRCAMSPCKYVELPKATKVGATAVLDVEQMGRLIGLIRDEKHGPLFTIMLLSGLRPQEALALTYGDITTLTDPTTGMVYPALSVSKALVMVKRGVWEVGPVKTKAGSRLVPLPLGALDALNRQRHVTTSLMGSQATAAESILFAHDTPRTHRNPDTVYEAWLRTLKRHGFPSMKLYATRHSSITALLASGVHPKVVAERHGHSTTAVTLEVYSHVLPSMQAGALPALTALLGQSTERILS